VKKIVLTGGPCSGKTTILQVLNEEFGSRIVFVPEVATILLKGGFPVPGNHLPWSEEWQSAFQSAVLPLQQSIEDAYVLMASKNGCQLLISDRGLLDGAAYTPGGITEFCHRYKVDIDEALSRYAAVIHLESLATAEQDKYDKTGNEARFEPLARAQELEQATRQAWQNHPRRVIIDGRRGIGGKINQVIGIVQFVLAEK